jgi:hypothetical protein
MVISKMRIVQNNWHNEIIMGSQFGCSNAHVLTSQQSNIDNSLNITNQPVNKTLNCAQPGGSNYLLIPTDQEEEEEDDDDYNVESKDLDVELEEDYDSDEIIDHAVSRMDGYNPFIGLGEIHPARNMHDTVGWAHVEYSLYESRVSADGPLAEYQTFNSKEHLQFAIFRWHI